MPISPALKQVAQAQAAQILAAKLPTYRYVPINATALQQLVRRIAVNAMFGGNGTFYTVWAEGIDIVLLDGTLHTIGPHYRRTKAEPAVREFLEYIALYYCSQFGFLGTYCVVNKQDSKDSKGNIIGLEGQPSNTFFDLPEDVGLLADQDPQSRAQLINDHKEEGSVHIWPPH